METVTGRGHVAAPHCRTIAEAKCHFVPHIAAALHSSGICYRQQEGPMSATTYSAAAQA